MKITDWIMSFFETPQDDFLDPYIHLHSGEDDAMAFNTIKEQRDTAMALLMKFASLKVHPDQFREWKSLSEELYKLQEDVENEDI